VEAQVYNPSYLGVWNQEERDSRPVTAKNKSWRDPISTEKAGLWHAPVILATKASVIGGSQTGSARAKNKTLSPK
jgi:hypothetical protein